MRWQTPHVWLEFLKCGQEVADIVTFQQIQGSQLRVWNPHHCSAIVRLS